MTDDAPQSVTGCPDGGHCHHHCLTGCWRVAHDTPLPSAFPSGKWSTYIRRRFGTVVQDGTPNSSPAAPAPAVGEEPDGTPPIHEAPEEYALRFVGPDGEGIPVIDLNALVQRLDQSVVNLRAWARVLDRYGQQAQKMSDDLAALRDTLNGDA